MESLEYGLLDDLLERTADTDRRSYWISLNMPGPIERLAGIWIAVTFAKVSEPSEYQWADWGSHKYREWGIVLAGPGIHMECGGQSLEIGLGEWYTYPPGVALRGYLYPGTIWAFIHIDGPQAPLYAKTVGWSEKGAEKGTAPLALGNTLLSTCLGIKNRAEDWRLLTQAFLWNVLHSCGVLTNIDDEEGTMPSDVQAVLDIINRNPSVRMDISELADTIGVNGATLRKHFLREIGMPIMHYWAFRRVHYAKELLAVTRLSISRIADESGFCDSKHFCRIFTKHEGCSPREYRKKIRIHTFPITQTLDK